MGVIAIVLKGYPRLSETFIAQEIHALEAHGLELRIISLRHPTDRVLHPVHREICAPVCYLPEYLHREPLRVLSGWLRARRLPGYRRARRAWAADLARDRSVNRLRRFGQAMVLAAELPENVERLHAHFLHTPASVARYAALARGLRWSVSAHARDIWTLSSWEKREKLACADFAVTCTRYNAEHLRALAPEAARVDLVYHGLDLSRFTPPPPRSEPPRDGGDPTRPVRLLSVGRAVDKKGYEVLLDALAQLPPGLAWRFDHVGGGPRLARLKRRARRLGIEQQVNWRGPLAQQDVIDGYRHADLFVLASRVARDGDRDGLPNVLMEAQSQRLACVASAVSAVPELIVHEQTGILVPADDTRALAGALAALIGDPSRRERLGAAAERRVRRDFSMHDGIARLLGRLRGEPTRSRGQAA